MSDRDIEKSVIALVNKARIKYGIPDRCTGSQACRLLGLRLVFQRLPPDQYGMLTSDGKVVISTEIKHNARRQFTIFHEITHYLLEEDGELYEYLTRIQRNNPKQFNATIERCCDIGAAEFLFPRSWTYAYIQKNGFSVDLIQPMAQERGGSIAAAAFQLAVCAPVDCYVVLCSWASNSLVVEQATKRDFQHFPLARGTHIPNDHLFYRVWESKQPLAEESYVPFRSGKTYQCEYGEARMIGSRVGGILYLGLLPPKEQLRLDFF